MGTGCLSGPSHLLSSGNLSLPWSFLLSHLFQEVPRTKSHPCNDFISSMNRCGPFFPPSKTGLLGPKTDMVAHLGKKEEWMLEDASGGFYLGKNSACGRLREKLSKCTRPVDWEMCVFSLLSTLALATFVPVYMWHSFLMAILPAWALHDFLLS